MKFYIIISLCVISLFASCTQKYKNNNPYVNDNNHPNYHLVYSGDIHFSLDSTTSYFFRASEYNEKDTTYSFLYNKDLLVYSYNNQKLLKKIQLKTPMPTSYSIINSDSIIVFDYLENSVGFYDDSGMGYSKKIINHTIPYFPFPSCKISPICYEEGEIIYWGNFAGEYLNENSENRRLMGIFNMDNSDIKYYVPYIDFYYNTNWGGGLFRWVYADYNPDQRIFIVSLPAAHELLIVSKEGELLKRVYSGSKYIDTIESFSLLKLDMADSDERTKHFVENHSYSNVLYDPYNRVYYRIAEIKSEYVGAMGWKKNISVVILNEQFQRIGETFIGNCNSNYRYAIFVNETGLHIPQESSEDFLSFKIYKYEINE
ncbi:MAG: DUF4221 family protein [Bacteroidaceae bacterium]|nr:DUF4221 family protein [Bacteroidaceae bacterium]